MSRIFLFFFLFDVCFASLDPIPVLYEGRVRPFGTLPKEMQVIEKLDLVPLNASGHWGTLSEVREKGKSLYSRKETCAIIQAEDPEALKEALLLSYKTLSGKPYLKSSNKTLYYPSLIKLKAELWLYYLPIKWVLFFGYFATALFFFLKREKIGLICLLSCFSIHSLTLALRCYILERAPVSNMAETVLYVPWIVILTTFFFRQLREAKIGGALTASFLIFLLPNTQTFETVQAVLDSQKWLIIHVLMVVGSYGIFFFSGVLGHIYLLKPNEKIEKNLIRSLYLGTGFLICGTILGGVWAAQSWGRFWDWDPKESWAFISSGMYLIWIHAYKFKKISAEWLARGAILGLMAITFTWYGVNYLLASGLHSYGFGSGGNFLYYSYLIFELGFLFGSRPLKNLLYKNWVIEKKERKK